jgi:hypothetical protein
MSKKRKRELEQQAAPQKKPRSIAAVAGTIVLILALVAVITYDPPKATVTTTQPPNSNQSTSYEFVKQGEVSFMTAKQVFLAAVDVEISEDESERQVGLMYRDKLAENQGMLFIFEGDEMRAFWMKNTILSLDMIFVNAQGEIVTIHKFTKPYSEESYASTRPARYVVEVNAGFTDKHKISVGDRISWKRL